jgi:hypothetical protein
MEKRAHQYKLTLEYLKDAKGEAMHAAPVELAFQNHDDIFSIIERLHAKDFFGDKNQSTEFAIGLKLFGEVMLRNRNHPLFEDLAPVWGSFMKKLKGAPDKDVNS